MRYFIVLCLCVLFSFFYVNDGLAEEAPSISAQNAIVMESESSRILYEKNAHDKKPIASITKIMTALIAIEQGNLDEKVKISERAVQIHGSSLYLKEGDEITLRSLLYGLMLRSGNDASIAIAEHVGGSVEGFIFLMNEKAMKLGMDGTNFTNPHGLDEDGHYSTAYDMALLMKEAMQNDTFQEISGTKTYRPTHQSYAWTNKNQLLTELYPYSTGGKTGFTKRSGRTLVSTAEKQKMSLIAVTLDAPDDWQDHITMFEQGFATYSLVKVVKKGVLRTHTTSNDIAMFVPADYIYPLTEEEKKEVQMDIVISNEFGKKQPYLRYQVKGATLLTIPLQEKRIEKQPTFFEKISRTISRWFT